MTTAEVFILIPKKVYMKTQPYQTRVSENPDIKHKSAQLSIINRMRPKEHIEAEINEKLSEQELSVLMLMKIGSNVQIDGQIRS